MASSEDKENSGSEMPKVVEAVNLAPSLAPDDGAVPDLILVNSGDVDGLLTAEDDSVILELSDLLPDGSGEVVLFTGEDLPVNILTSETITAMGIADTHVTAAGLDVTGHHFYSFESGITVYSLTDLLITSNEAA